MRLRVLCILIFIFTVFFIPQVTFAKGNSSAGTKSLVVKGGLDFMGEGEVEYDGDSDDGDVDNSFSIGAEFYFGFESILAGAGAAYLVPRELEDSDGKITLIPVYAVVNIPFSQGGFTPYITGQLGYNFFYIDSDLEDELDYLAGAEMDYTTEGGLYFALGGGVIFDNNIQVEFIYSHSAGSIDIENEDYDVDETLDLTYTKVTLSVGYRFDI